MAERRIGSRTYRYERMPGAEGLRVLLRGLKLLAPIGPLLDAVVSEDEDAEPAALLAAIAASDPDGIVSLATGLVSQCREDGRLIEDTHSLLTREEFARVALFAIQVELGEFFRDGPGVAIRRAGLVVGARAA